jgi:hypothetical protein
MTKLGIGIPVYDVIYTGYLYYYIIVKAHLPDSTMSHYDYVYLLSKGMSYMTMLISDSHIHFQFLFSSTFILIFLFLPIKTLIFFNIEGSLFHFSFCLLCSLLCCEVHSDVRNSVISLSFALLFVRASSHTCPECPSML